MSEREYTTVDKATWGDGPWQDEPDKLSWTDDTTGLPCLIVRNHRGALCGYVGVSTTHPWYSIDYGECPADGCSEVYCYEHSPVSIIDVHGGLTFASGCSHDAEESTGICHIPDPGQPDDVWWFGFDCAHAFDLTPASDALIRDVMLATYGTDPDGDDVYRNVGYVREQVALLAAQLTAAAP